MTIARNGRYVVKAELAAFAAATQRGAAERRGAERRQTGAGGGLRDAAGFASGGGGGVAADGEHPWRGDGADARAAESGRAGGWARCGGRELGRRSDAGAQMPTLAGVGAGGDATATDSVTVNGAMGQTNGLANYSEDEIRQRIQDAMQQAQRQGGAVGDMANNLVAGMLGGNDGLVARADLAAEVVASAAVVAAAGWWEVGIPQVRSDAPARQHLLPGQLQRAECDAVLADRRADAEAGRKPEQLWDELYRDAFDSGAGEAESEAVCVSECDRAAEYDAGEPVWHGADAGRA